MLPNFLQTALWSYDLKKMTKNRYKNLIITQILNFGNWRQLQWLLQNYSAKEIKEILKNPPRGMWRADVLNYWEKIYNIHVPKSKAAKALWPNYAS